MQTTFPWNNRAGWRAGLTFLGFLLLAGLPAFGQIPAKVAKIKIEHIGPQTASDSLIKANIRVKEGDLYSSASVDEDVRNLYKTGYFENIRVNKEETPDGIVLTYVLKGKPRLTDIRFEGNKKFSDGKLRKKLTSKIGEPLSEQKLFLDAQAIKELYQKKGYPRTEVTYVVSSDENTGRGTATFQIKEMPRVVIEDVVFEDAHAFSQRKLRKQLKTRRHWFLSWLTGSGKLKDEQFEDDKERLAEFYRNEGYIDFAIKDVQFDYQTPRKLIIRFFVHEGHRYRVGAIDFKGVTLFSTNDILKDLKMKVGDIFTPKGLDKDIEAVRDFYGAKGYIDTRVLARKNPNVETGTMDLLFEIEEGGKSFIEKIEIKGNVKTKDRVIRRELAVTPGEPFNMVKVKLSKQRLEGLTYFERVDTQPEPTDVPNRRNLVVNVVEKNTGNFSIGAGFSSVDSILGFVELSQGNFDIFNPPLFMGGGQKARLRAQFGTKRQDYQLTFIEPWFLQKKLQLSVDLFHRELGFVSIHDLYEERDTGARVGLSRALGSDFLIGGISYTIENIGIINVADKASQAIKDEAGNRLVSKVGLSLAYDTRNSALLPDKGQRTELSTEVAGGPLGADTDFYKLELRTSWYFKGPFEGHILELVGRTGIVDSYDDTTRVPLFDRWFLGGLYTLRGYRYRQVGPRDNTGEPIGGNTYWFGSAEYSIPIIERLRFAVFYDIGMVYEDVYHYNFGHYNDNWGLGLRINLPIGPLRLDYGIPITHDPENGSSGRFQFGVGYTREF